MRRPGGVFVARGWTAVGLALVGTLVSAVGARSQGAASSLKSVPVPRPLGLERYVRDERALVVLGKALFWDMQLSSDSRVACATCHFHAGADHRRQNQVAATRELVPANLDLTASDFPMRRGLTDAGDRIGSAGAYPRAFTGVNPDGRPDSETDLDSLPPADPHDLATRQVTRRNAPSVINAVFSFRQFWDGRASDLFTGRTSAGESDARATVLVDNNGRLVAEKVRLEGASLASQAVEPPISDHEMSGRGRTWPMIGRKMLAARPLAQQRVATDDSVLGPYADGSGRGLSADANYLSLVRAAFRPEYWRSAQGADGSGRPQRTGATAARFTQAEYNFPLFFGLAIQAYESTLVADDTPYDRLLDGQNGALSGVELDGLRIFRDRKCSTCHANAELTLATVRMRTASPSAMIGPELGFMNTGVEPVMSDIGFGGKDALGMLISPTFRRRPAYAPVGFGWFKTPALRNVEFTGPYFHNGSHATLEQIVDFYTHAGDYESILLTGWTPDPYERIALPAFLEALSDDRVRFERAPFDHPELCVSTGHVEENGHLVPQAPGSRLAAERWAEIPVVGAAGSAVPLQTFDELLHGVGDDGSRAHTLTTPCAIP